MMRVFGSYYGLPFATVAGTAGSCNQMKILVIHGLEPDSRQTTVDYVSAFLDSAASAQVTVANIFGFMPDWIGEVKFDLAVVTTEALLQRSTPVWPVLEKRVLRAMASAKRKVLMPQDDYTDSAKLDRLAVTAKVDAIYSPLVKGLERIYPKSIQAGIRFEEALTGYFDQTKIGARKKMAKPHAQRSIDIGQRVNRLAPQFGEIGIRKFNIAEVVCSAAKKQGFITDFSADPGDVFLGEQWFQFLGETKFTVSCRGGSSIVDAHGKLAKRLDLLKKYLPWMTQESAFRIAKIGCVVTGEFDAISPRLFDAAMMGVCQILLEDDYVGMKPWVHYIPLKRDYSNVDEILSAMRDVDRVGTIVKNAYDYLIDPARFSYKSLVEKMIAVEIGTFGLGGGESTLVDVDAIYSRVPSMSIRKSFSLTSSLARGRIRAGLIKFSSKSSTYGDLSLDQPAVGMVLQNWLDFYMRKPRFRELLIYRWCPLSWFLEAGPTS